MSEQQHLTNNFKITESGAQSDCSEQTARDNNISVDIAQASTAQSENTIHMTNLMRQASLSPESSEDNLCRPDWLKARDSLENLIVTRTEKAFGENISNSKSTSFPMHKNAHSLNESPHSDSDLGALKSPASTSISKVLTWDPWEKLGHKKEVKRRPPLEVNVDGARRDFTAGDELRYGSVATTSPSDVTVPGAVLPGSAAAETETYSYRYQPYRPKNSKSVEFTNEVQVVYITGDKIVGQSREPLKKELEQQIRNKEMRRGHSDEFVQQRPSLWPGRRLPFQ